MAQIEEITESRFETEVLESEEPVLVFFYAPGGGESTQVGDALASLAEEFAGRLRVVRVNVYREAQLAAAQNVHRIPVLQLFEGGLRLGRKVGPREVGELRAWLEELLPPEASEEEEEEWDEREDEDLEDFV
jgi:thioredoxin 1